MAHGILCLLAGIVFTTLAGFGHGQVADSAVFGNSRVTDPASALQYLIDRNWFGTDGSASELIDLPSSLKIYQEWAGIPQTGELDATTIAKMNSLQCGVPDFDSSGYKFETSRRKRFETLGTPWPQNDLTWYLQSITADLPRDTIRSELAKAFQYWQDASALTFREVFTGDADIIVDFFRLEHGDGNSFDGRGMVLAHAFSPGRGRGGDMHFDDDETFTASTGVNLQQVAVHEIGHSLGLGHSSDQNAIMAAFYTYRPNLVLGDDDIRGIQSLYGPPTANPVTRPPIPVTETEMPTTTTPTPPRTIPGIFCNGEFDAAVESHLDDGVLFFQGEKVFKVLTDFSQAPGYPKAIAEEFPGVPDFVDAAFQWEASSAQKYTYIFKGDYYWRFFNGIPSAGYPRPISAWGIPGSIDGAFRWPGNRRIYFFKGEKYYRYNTMSYRIDAGYPQPLTRWRGVVFPISAVLAWNGNSFFFTGQYFQVFFDSQFAAAQQSQTARRWLGCQTEGLREATTMNYVDDDDDNDDNGGIMFGPSLSVSLMTSFVCVWFHQSF